MAKSEARSVAWSPQDEGTTRRTRIRQSLLAVVAVVVIGTLIVEGCARWEFRTFDPFQPP